MPIFKSTYNIIKKQDEDEAWNRNWMDSDTLVLPPYVEWDYSRELNIDDIDIWEVLYEATGGIGLYAAWNPWAEFYLITSGVDSKKGPTFINGAVYWDRTWETYYGSGAQDQVRIRAKDLGIPVCLNQAWVEPDKMWLYPEQNQQK